MSMNNNNNNNHKKDHVNHTTQFMFSLDKTVNLTA